MKAGRNGKSGCMAGMRCLPRTNAWGRRPERSVNVVRGAVAWNVSPITARYVPQAWEWARKAIPTRSVLSQWGTTTQLQRTIDAVQQAVTHRPPLGMERTNAVVDKAALFSFPPFSAREQYKQRQHTRT